MISIGIDGLLSERQRRNAPSAPHAQSSPTAAKRRSEARASPAAPSRSSYRKSGMNREMRLRWRQMNVQIVAVKVSEERSASVTARQRLLRRSLRRLLGRRRILIPAEQNLSMRRSLVRESGAASPVPSRPHSEHNIANRDKRRLHKHDCTYSSRSQSLTLFRRLSGSGGAAA